MPRKRNRRSVLATWAHEARRHRRALWLSLIGVFAFAFLLPATGADLLLWRYVSAPILFSARAALGYSPALSDSVTVLGLDDAADGELGRRDLDLQEWATLLSAIAARGPKTILIDKLFSRERTDEDIDSFVQKLRGVTSTIYIAAFVHQNHIAGLDILDPTRFALSRGPDDLRDDETYPVFYGPSTGLIDAFAGVGHVNFSDGLVDALLNLDGKSAIPYLGMRNAKEITRTRGVLKIDGHEVRLWHERLLVPNYLEPRYLWSKTFSLKGLLKRAQNGQSLEFIKPGGTVVLLPALFTGTTDWAQTPVGRIPGGHVVTAFANSVATGQWLSAWETPFFLIPFVGIFGLLFGLWASPFALGFGALITLASAPAVGVATMIFNAALIPWIDPVVAFLTPAVVVFLARMRAARREQDRLAVEMETTSAVQAMFLPREPAIRDGLKVVSRFRPATECSGDWWRWVHGPHGVDYLVVADVEGHGAPAALITGVMHTVASAWAAELSQAASSPAAHEVMSALARGVLNTGVRRMICCGVLRFDLTEHSVQFASGGYLPAILVRPDAAAGGPKRPLKLATPGNPFGIAEDTKYRSKSALLAPGDRIFVFSDGVSETEDARGRAFGFDRITRTVADLSRPLEDVLDGLLADVDRTRGDASQDDDITAIAVEVLPAAEQRKVG